MLPKFFVEYLMDNIDGIAEYYSQRSTKPHQTAGILISSLKRDILRLRLKELLPNVDRRIIDGYLDNLCVEGCIYNTAYTQSINLLYYDDPDEMLKSKFLESDYYKIMNAKYTGKLPLLMGLFTNDDSLALLEREMAECDIAGPG